MKETGYIDVISFNILLKDTSAASIQNTDEVLVDTLLEACIRLKDVGRLTSALRAFRSQGTVPSEHAYATVLKAYGHARALPDVFATWQDMLERKVRPTEATFAAMVEACVANGAVDDAIRVFAEMKEKIPDFATPASTYQTLIRVLVQRKQQDKALEIYEDMRKSKVPPNLATFNALIDVCARHGDVERAASLFRDMCALGVTPDLITYSTVIKGYCVQGDLEQAIQLFTLMRKRGLRPDQILFNSLLSGCAAAKKPMRALAEQVLRDVEEAVRVTEAMSTKYGFQVNTAVHTCLLQAMLNHGRVADAMQVFAEMQSPDSKTYSALIRGCLKQHRVAEAVHVADAALRTGTALEPSLAQDVAQFAGRRRVPLPEALARIAA